MKKGKWGFTLLELLAVVALLALLASAMLPKMNSLFRVSVQSGVRRFGSVVRFAYDQSVLTGKLHRILIDLDAQTWSVEATNPGELPVDKARKEFSPYNKNKSIFSDDKNKESDEPAFSNVGSGIIGAVPRGVHIAQVESWRLGTTPVTKGKVSIYAYPNGLIDEATVRLAEEGKEEKQSYNVTIQPLTGRVRIQVENGL
ncbi:MAG: prepilin-type N-terminal cleavage/methylation domain-containing protein [Bdellovibrionales bacterium]|nr:prepilin-type N-terminal cleavage/methylation domain-containing protein [Bdellovibrionales bacterium]